MSNSNNYFKEYYEGLKSLLIGMRTSLRVYFRKNVTQQYPENRHTTLYVPQRHRAMLVMPHNENNEHKCIACGICQMNCPNDTIKIISEMVEEEDGKKRKVLVKYEYDLGACMFCQLCTNSCPQGAIEFSNDFENAVFQREKLLLTLNKPGSSVIKKQ